MQLNEFCNFSNRTAGTHVVLGGTTLVTTVLNRQQNVCVAYQGPEDVDGEEGDGEGNEADRLQSALQLQVVLRSPQTQPARDGRQGRDEEEAGHVAQQGALLTARARVLQPLGQNTRVNQWGERQRLSVSSRPTSFTSGNNTDSAAISHATGAKSMYKTFFNPVVKPFFCFCKLNSSDAGVQSK